MFQPVPQHAQFPKLEEAILEFWKERRIYEQSLARRADAPRFVFFEGPPTANGMPHPGHCLTRAIKDLFPRYKTMRGYLCERKAGWDTHGLPVEVEVCKELGIHAKEEIEAFGVEPFIHKCQESVWRYMQEWERLTERIGFWLHLDEAYVTYHQSYVESVWWSLKNLFDRGLLYQGHKIVWWWAQGGTALSSGEVGQGYREVADPSVYVKFPIIMDEKARSLGFVNKTSLLVWTTTPWTLPANQFVAIHPDVEYAIVEDGQTGNVLIIASAIVEQIATKTAKSFQVLRTISGENLVDLRYGPPFTDYYRFNSFPGRLSDGTDQQPAWRVVAADFVTTATGTGIVHVAPAFGEDDFEVLVKEQARYTGGSFPVLLCPVSPDGKFTSEAPTQYEGRWVKDCDKDICRELRQRELLFHQEQYLHEYPFCWRADEDPLIQYPRKSWFIKTTAFKDAMLANNAKINWLPEHIRDGRFGNFLETNVDWALSRERYWGTPLPIWVCDKTGEKEAIDSYASLLAKPGVRGTEVWDAAKKARPELPDDLRVHKPYIDAITYDSPFAPGARMQRVTEVIDCWYDSGAMPFAQWGYPHQNQEKFAAQFPADFISEALDQTRGWFYSQLAISTMLFGEGARGEGRGAWEENSAGTGEAQPRTADHGPRTPFPHPFKNCIVLGLMLGEDGQKMSKSKRNYREPGEIFDKYGADALRWYFFANQPPWTSIRYKEQAIKDTIPEFLLRFWNCYSFFTIYANIDGFDPVLECGDLSPLSNFSGSKNNADRPVPPAAAKFQSGDMSPHSKMLTPSAFAGAKSFRPASKRSELDRWVLSELHRTLAAVVARMDAYDNFAACGHIHEFVDALSNWYVRRSRDRFWSSDKQSPDKLDAYWTLYECLLTTTKMIAPFTPFLAETLWQNLAGVFGDQALASVHLCDYPVGDPAAIDETLSARMKLLRDIASLGRSARMDNKLKVRQPLSKVEVILSDTTHQPWLEQHNELLREELNVKAIEYTKDADKYITYHVQPNFKRLGPRIGKLLPGVKQALAQADGGVLLAQLTAIGKVTLEVGGDKVELDNEDIQVRLQAKPGWAAAQGPGVVVVLNTELTPRLIREGYANDLVRLIQDRRKEIDCKYTDRIELGVVTDSDELKTAIAENANYIQTETLADRLLLESLAGAEGQPHEIGGATVTLYVIVVTR